MNKLSIVPIDSAVYVDGEVMFGIDLSFVPADIHALQWQNTAGWIERKGQADEIIEILPDWANQAITLWTQAKDAIVTVSQ